MAWSSSNLEVMTETSFDQSWDLIGGGGYGQIWKTKHLQGGYNVAIKSLGLDNGFNNEDIKKEAEFMRAAEGPYSMGVIGVFRGVIPRIGKICVGLVMEMMERGSLKSLQGKLDHLLPWPLVFRLAHQVALGMNDLHCLEHALIHKDLKPDNILLDADLNVKITDFGITKLVNNATKSRLKNCGTPPYMPPEALQGGATYAYDVYSYAMLLYSILHTGHSFPEFNNSKGERPSLEYVKDMNASGLEELVDLMVKCWDQTPDLRPTFKECIAVTERLYEKHKNEICDAVLKVQQELDGVILPEEETPSDLKELRDMMKKMMRNELQLQKEMADMRVELRNASTELQLQKEKMAGVEKENAVINYRLTAMEPKLAACMEPKLATMEITVNPKLATMEKMIADHGVRLSTVDTRLTVSEDKVQKKLAAMEPKLATMEKKIAVLAVQHPTFPAPQTRKDFLQYSSPLSLDLNTINDKLSLSEEKRKMTYTEQEQPYPDHVERFTDYRQVLCTEALSERRYWEVERSGYACIAVCYKDTDRDDRFGDNDKSWCLRCFDKDYTFKHNRVETKVSGSFSSRVGVYLDHKAGTLSFYRVSDTMTLLHTVKTTFTQPLYPGIMLGYDYGDTAELCKTW